MRRSVPCALVGALLTLSAASCADNSEPYVYYLNFKPEADAAWQEIAEEYTALTGIPVKVVTAAVHR